MIRHHHTKMSDNIRESIWACALACLFEATVMFETLECFDRYQNLELADTSYWRDERAFNSAIERTLQIDPEDIARHGVTLDYILARPESDDDYRLERAGRSSGYNTFEDDIPGTTFKRDLLGLIFEMAAKPDVYGAEDFDNMCMREVAPAHLDAHMIPDLAGMVMEYI